MHSRTSTKPHTAGYWHLPQTYRMGKAIIVTQNVWSILGSSPWFSGVTHRWFIHYPTRDLCMTSHIGPCHIEHTDSNETPFNAASKIRPGKLSVTDESGSNLKCVLVLFCPACNVQLYVWLPFFLETWGQTEALIYVRQKTSETSTYNLVLLIYRPIWEFVKLNNRFKINSFSQRTMFELAVNVALWLDLVNAIYFPLTTLHWAR